jgi:ribosomal protein L20
MKKTKLFNDISPELINKTKLKPGQQVVYRVHGITPDPMNPGKWAIPSSKNVPPTDQIWDPIKEEYIEIAAVRSVSPDGNHTFHDIYFFGNQGGHMILLGGRAVDQEIHSYMSLCNYNGSNPDRDTSKEIYFELVDESAKSDKERKQRNLKREALNAAADLSPEDVRNYIAALGQEDSGKIEVLRNRLEDMADNDPSGFLDLINNKQAVMKATLNRAVNKGVILFDSEQSRFTWPNGEVILVVSRTTGGDNIEELVGFCVANAKGEKVYQTIQSKAKK